MGAPTGSAAQAAILKAMGARWPDTKCQLCYSKPASGVFLCQFTTSVNVKVLCAECGLYQAAHKWTGFMSPKLMRIELLCSVSTVDPTTGRAT